MTTAPAGRSPLRIALWSLLAAAVVAGVAVTAVVTLTNGSGGRTRAAGQSVANPPSAGPSGPASSASTPTTATSTPRSSASALPTRVVHVTSMQTDGATYGVGMPVVLYVSPVPTSAAAFDKAVRVAVNGSPANGAWYWEQPTADEVQSHTVEAHYRTPGYWPADSRVHVSIPIGGLSAGQRDGHRLVFDDKLTSLDFRIGDAHISTVDANDLRMTVRSNGRVVKTVPVSLGEASFPTFNGTKIVMQKGEDVPGTNRLRPNGTVLMSGVGYTDDPVQWSVRITRSGEYVHAAPWNGEIGSRSTSHGCTNLRTEAAEWFYDFSRVGDVVTYEHTDGKTMPSWDGLGDWNLPWTQWTQGGLLATA